MFTLGTKQMEMFIRVQESRSEFALAATEGSHGTALFDQLGLLVEDLRGNLYEQSRSQSALRECTGNKTAAHAELLRQLDFIYQAARVLAPERPGLEDKFLSPREESDQALLILARTYGTDAFPLRAEFIKRGLGVDFIADLSAAAQAFDAAINERTQALGRQIAATAEIKRLLTRGLRIVRELRVVVRNVYADDSSKLALWESASHVEKPPRRARPKGDGNQPTPPPAED